MDIVAVVGRSAAQEGVQVLAHRGIRILAPHTLSVSAKSTEFDVRGREINIDFTRMMRILTDAGFQGYAAVEYFGNGIGRREGSVLTRELLERVRRELA